MNDPSLLYIAAETRGLADHGWLKSYHSFSFANYYDSERMNFGALRVLNDDEVAGGRGFGAHPHENMEIISVPLEGDLEHQDSMGTRSVIREGDVQVMSAGTGVTHSEFNLNPDRKVAFLQIWIIPKSRGIAPRYDQAHFEESDFKGQWKTIVSPEGHEGLTIHQDAWLSRGDFSQGATAEYRRHKEGNGLYLFVLEGMLRVGDILLNRRDALEIRQQSALQLLAEKDSKILLIEVPMEL